MNARTLRSRKASGNIAVAVCFTLGFAGCQSPKNDKPVVRNVERSNTTPSPGAAAAAENARKPEDVPDAKPPEILPNTHMAAGRLHESQGHYDRAAEQYSLVTALAPKHVEAYNRLGIVLDHLSRFTEADQAFQHAIKLAPKQAYLHNNLAFSYITQNRWKDAEAALKEAVALRPDFTRAHVNLGMVLAQQDKFDEAMTQFDRALTKGDAYYNLGLMYQSRRKVPEAASAFKTALQHDPKLTAAQKRLDSMPPDVVKSVGTIAIATASPAAGSAQIPPAHKSARPQPASAPSASPAAIVEHKAVDPVKESRHTGKELVWQTPEQEDVAQPKIEPVAPMQPEPKVEPKAAPAPVKTEQPIEMKPSKVDPQVKTPVEKSSTGKDASKKLDEKSSNENVASQKKEVKVSSETTASKKTDEKVTPRKSEEKPVSEKIVVQKKEEKVASEKIATKKSDEKLVSEKAAAPKKIEEKAVSSGKPEAKAAAPVVTEKAAEPAKRTQEKPVASEKRENVSNPKSGGRPVAKSAPVVAPEVRKPVEKMEARHRQFKASPVTPMAPIFMFSPIGPAFVPAPTAPAPAPAVVPSANPFIDPAQAMDEDCIEADMAHDMAISFSPNPFECDTPEPDFSMMDVSTVDFSMMDFFVIPDDEPHDLHIEAPVALSFETPVSVILDPEFAAIVKAAEAASSVPADILDPCPTHEVAPLIPSTRM